MSPLRILPGRYAVCRLPAGTPLPPWATEGEFTSVTRTPDEVSVVCAESSVPQDIRSEPGWRILQVEGPLDFALTGVLAAIATPLANAGISIFAISTFDTDYVLVKEETLPKAKEALHM